MALVIAAVFVGACGTTDGETRDDVGGSDTGDDVSTADVGTDTDPRDVCTSGCEDVTADVASGCTGSGPMCTHACGGDWFEAPECVDDEWVCPEDTIPMGDCPPGTCFGAPLPGETCSNGWMCEPWETGALATCPASEFLCADCRGFEEAYDTGACTCSCDNGTVSCVPNETDCVVESSSNLDGVTIEFSDARCSWALDEVAGGVELGYTITIENDVPGVIASPQDAGGCGQPGASGLIAFHRVFGGDESWCICDEGLCMGNDDVVTLPAGTYEGSFTWNGVNWGGPSDTGNPEGDPFPAGSYVVSVSATGVVTGGALEMPFAVGSTLQITLTE